MNIDEIHDFVYEGDEDYDPEPDDFEIRVGIELITGGEALMTVEAESKADVIDALTQVVASDVLSQIIENLESL
ncbi:hypothetical protein [Mycobacteroides salmoniphilum]|uniref:hypothetical protein n=1 Tax=Mycobacteroides salmoniphilum TaxID=404941 RepID=UPI0009927E3A|nr:hypothetical protein [Mycobacteroides salmoniphilum]